MWALGLLLSLFTYSFVVSGKQTNNYRCLVNSATMFAGNSDSCVQLLDSGLTDVYVVRYVDQSCPEHYDEIAVICEDSGWGDEEANVVCKSEMNTAYGLGSKAITHAHAHTHTRTHAHTILSRL